MRSLLKVLISAPLALAPASAFAQSGLLFAASGDKDTTAEVAGGDAVPNFQSEVGIVPDGAKGGALRWGDGGYVAWKAPGNIYAQRGTLAFFWRSRDPVGEAPFAIFRVGFADHTSWDMAFLRIDWNGHGFDAFVTDANLTRVRVSLRMDPLPAPTEWHHIAFAWDEAQGVRLFVDGKPVAVDQTRADLDTGLDQFGLAGRIISPHQVQSRYHFMRGSDVDEIRIYDHMLGATEAVAALAAEPRSGAGRRAEIDTRRPGSIASAGTRAQPPALDAPVTASARSSSPTPRTSRNGCGRASTGSTRQPGPASTTARSLPGRDDYFELPDWNVYVEGGKAYT